MRKCAAGQLALNLGAVVPEPAPTTLGGARTRTEPPDPAWAEPYPRGSWPWPRCGCCGDPLDWCDRAHRVQRCPPCAVAWGRERLALLGADGNPAPPDPPVAGWLPGWPALCDRCGRPCGDDGCRTCGTAYSG